MSELNIANRTLAIMDNLPFLRSLNNECIDLIAIDPPFAANETFTNRPKPPISQAEFDEEVALSKAHGVLHNEGIGHTRVAVPRNNPLAEWIDANRIPGYLQIKNPHERLDALDKAEMVSWSNNGRPSIIRPTEVSYGAKINNLWDDITRVSGKERTGYATQKPLALYQRIIQASSNPGDVVLDIFAGCATTAVSAERLKRKWIACDMAYRSWTMLKRRFYLNGFALTDMTDSTLTVLGKNQTEMQEAESYTIGPDELPIRTDQDPAPFYYLQQGRGRGRRSTQTASWSGRISKEEAKSLLIKQFGPVCWGCGYEPRRPNGTLDDTLLEVDHIRARRAAEGTQGDDELYNLALLHRTCNGIKRNKLTLEQLREYNALNGLLYVNSTRELVDLFDATKYANEQITAHIMEHGAQYRLDVGG